MNNKYIFSQILCPAQSLIISRSPALSATIALLIFPVAIEMDQSISTHRYGLGYGLGWGGAFFFLAAAVCMSLDDLVRESSRAKCCRWCWRSKAQDRNELRQV